MLCLILVIISKQEVKLIFGFSCYQIKCKNSKSDQTELKVDKTHHCAELQVNTLCESISGMNHTMRDKKRS